MYANVGATTYNCFDVNKQASLGINGGVVTVLGDQSQKTCKFSVDDATVDAIGSRATSLNDLLQHPEALVQVKGGLEQFRGAMISPFGISANSSLVDDFNSVFAKNVFEVASCLADLFGARSNI